MNDRHCHGVSKIHLHVKVKLTISSPPRPMILNSLSVVQYEMPLSKLRSRVAERARTGERMRRKLSGYRDSHTTLLKLITTLLRDSHG